MKKAPRDIIQLEQGDITKITVDAIVNAANTSLMGGGGVDGTIHRAGGAAILEDCRKIVARQGGCKVGEAVITTAGNLPATWVIHTVGPVWNGGENQEKSKLAACYRNSLELAAAHGCKTIAFPNISTGIYKFPKNEAAAVAVETVLKFLQNDKILEKIIFICYDKENYFYMDRYLKYKVFTVPAMLYAGRELLGFIEIGLEDDGMGVLSGELVPNDAYKIYSKEISKYLNNEDIDKINEFTKNNKFRIVTQDNVEFSNPAAGLLVYEIEGEPIRVELNGVDAVLWERYFT